MRSREDCGDWRFHGPPTRCRAQAGSSPTTGGHGSAPPSSSWSGSGRRRRVAPYGTPARPGMVSLGQSVAALPAAVRGAVAAGGEVVDGTTARAPMGDRDGSGRPSPWTTRTRPSRCCASGGRRARRARLPVARHIDRLSPGAVPRRPRRTHGRVRSPATEALRPRGRGRQQVPAGAPPRPSSRRGTPTGTGTRRSAGSPVGGTVRTRSTTAATDSGPGPPSRPATGRPAVPVSPPGRPVASPAGSSSLRRRR